MKNIIPAIFLCLCSYFASAQNNHSIRGVIADTISHSKLQNATITVMNSKDSILYKFTRTKADGSFSIVNMAPGNFLLLVTYRDYADYVQPFTLDAAHPVQNFGQLSLIMKAKLLEEVIVNGMAPITIKGDTTVFNASQYKIQPNDRVEDLLKQMPGIQVDQNGKIIAQGVQVQKVLVEGEEFFGSDPTLVTRNLRADMVKSVELFDKKSDQAKITGIDDGERTKTLNVILKDDSKKGYFGKTECGESPDLEHYVGQAMFNSFKSKSKISAYGTVGNTNKLGLSSQDNAKYGSGSGGMMITGSDGSVIDLSGVLGSGVVTGLPTSRSAGIHYDTKWNKDKQTFNMNYATNFNGNKLVSNTLSQNNLPGGAINGISDLNRNNENASQRADLTYVGNFNPTTMLRVSVSGSISNSNSQEGYLTTNTRAANMLNHSDRTITNDGNTKNLNMGAAFTKRFKKAGRSLSFSANGSLSRSNSTQYLYALTDYYNSAGIKDSTGVTDQYKPSISKSSYMFTNLSYSEPLSKTLVMRLGYGLNLSGSVNDRQSYNKSASGKYDVHDNIYSNNFDTDLLNNSVFASLNFNRKKTLVNFQASIGAASQKQTDLNSGQKYNRNYVNWDSYGQYTYRFSQQKSLNVTLSGYSQQPGIYQIQPVKVNTDPLFITVGNPDLNPYYSTSTSVRYSSTKPLTGQSLFLSGTYYFRSNVIVNKTTTDEAGKTITQYVNLTEKHPDYFQFDITTGTKLKKSDINLNLNWNTTGQHNYTYVNSILNTNQLYTFNFYTTISKTKVKKYDFNIRFGPGYNLQLNSVQKQNNTNGWVLRDDNTFNLYLPGKMQLTTTANYIFRQKSDAFPGSKDLSMFTVNSAINKKFFKKENLIFSLSGNDLLNQNVSFTRNSSSTNLSTQTYTNTLSRYYMISLIWDFVKPNKAASPAAGAGSMPLPVSGGATVRPSGSAVPSSPQK